MYLFTYLHNYSDLFTYLLLTYLHTYSYSLNHLSTILLNYLFIYGACSARVGGGAATFLPRKKPQWELHIPEPDLDPDHDGSSFMCVEGRGWGG